ncbi:hypothetical protein DL96DRAFT_1605604 [Flagelloscypha sp. PMI_526]|nr:hypothetical protein DL96DRAFT_1605604 [Flagelloscypha sp. PMI_526]
MAERDEEIDISDDEQFTEVDRRELLTPIVTRVVEALGGLEDRQTTTARFARLLWESRVLVNDLIPILLCTAGKGLVDDKRAISAADLITAMTWPIDIAEELKELDDEHDLHVDYTQLIQSHRFLQALLNIMLAPLAKPPKDRQERDGQIINVVLHLIRNLAFIKDLPLNSHASADQSNTYNDKLFNNWNTLILEIFYLLFRGVRPDALAADQAKQSTAKLHSLLAAEQRTRAEVARKATSRHSRFGTTISVSLNTNKKQGELTTTEPTNPRDSIHGSKRAVLLHRQSAWIMDLTKKTGVKKIRTTDELSREENLSVEAKTLLQNLAIEMLDAVGAYNEYSVQPFWPALLKDIRSERAKITEKDHLRLLYITKWFLEFFLAMKARNKEDSARWNFGLIAEVTERAWIVWVLKCMREAVDSKPKAWTSLQAGIECLTQLLLLIDAMSSSQVTEPTLREAAEILQHQLVYNGEILDIAFESVRTYKEGTQSLVYLDASVHLAHALLRMLEKLGKGDGVYVRRKGRKRVKKRGNAGDEDDEMNEEDAAVPDEEEIITEALFSFEAFQMRFAHADITKTLLAYLSRYKDFSSSSSSSSSERIRRVVSLMHRQAVKSKAEGLFFNVSTLSLFKSILDDHKQNFFPKEQPYKDLISFVNYILRQFFKNMQEKPFLAIEALFPMNRGHWKQFSSWEPEKKEGRQRGAENRIDERFPQDVQVKKGYSWSQQVGIAIAVLVGDEKRSLVELAKTFLEDCISKRQETINMVDQMKNGEQPEEQPDGDEHDIIFNRNKPSAEALSQIEDYRTYHRMVFIHFICLFFDILELYFTADQDEAAQEATRNPHFKLLLRLCHMFVRNEGTY